MTDTQQEPTLDNGIICTMDTLMAFLDNSSTGDSIADGCMETVEETLDEEGLDEDKFDADELAEIAADHAKDMLIDAARADAPHIRQMLLNAINGSRIANELQALVEATFSDWIDEKLEWHAGDGPGIVERATKSALAEYQEA